MFHLSGSVLNSLSHPRHLSYVHECVWNRDTLGTIQRANALEQWAQAIPVTGLGSTELIRSLGLTLKLQFLLLILWDSVHTRTKWYEVSLKVFASPCLSSTFGSVLTAEIHDMTWHGICEYIKLLEFSQRCGITELIKYVIILAHARNM